MYGLKLHGVSVINGNVVVTGRLTRTSDGDPVSMDVYLVGPENFTFGRDMFISGTYLGGKMLLVGSNLVVPGMNHYADAVATNLFGVDNEALKLITSDVGNLQLTESENRSSVLRASLPSSLSHTAISKGSSVVLEVAYNDQWMTAFTGEINRISTSSDVGQELSVEMQNKTTKRLSQWAPEQGIYIPSQSYNIADASDLTQLVWTTANLKAGVSDVGDFAYDNVRWTYGGSGWGVLTSVYCSSDSSAYATFTFRGTGIKYKYHTNPDRGIMDFWIDGVKVATVNAYGGTSTAEWQSAALAFGSHDFKVTRNASSPAYTFIEVWSVTVQDTYTNDTQLSPKRLNDMAVMYTASRSTPGGIMQARFWNEGPNDTTKRNPRFGVGVNYNRETKADAATRLKIDYNDVEDDQCGHNGLVAIYSRLEVSNTPGIVLYLWRDSQLLQLTSWSITLPTNILVWLQIRSIDNEVIVSWRQDGAATWNKLSAYNGAGVNMSWDPEVGGHGCVVMEKRSMIATSCYVLSSQDMTIGCQNLYSFPRSGIVMVEDEQIAYSWNTSNIIPNPDYLVRYSGTMDPDAAFATGQRVVIHNNGTTTLNNEVDNSAYLNGLAAVAYTKGTSNVYDRTYRIVGFDRNCPSMWFPKDQTYFTAGWPVWKGDTTKTSFVNVGANGIERGLYVTPSYYDAVSDMELYLNEQRHWIRLLPALHVSQRGLNGTQIATHGEVPVVYYVDIHLFVDKVRFFSTDEDIPLADALKKIIRLTGGSFKDGAAVDTKVVSTPGAYWGTTSFSAQSDFIADVTIPANMPSDALVGVALQCPTPINQSLYNALYVYLYGSDLCFAKLTQIYEAIEIVPSVVTNADRTGTLRVSVQDDRIAVWLNHRLLYVFVNPYAANPYGSYAGVAVTNSTSGSVLDVPCRVSELCDLMTDITVGVRGNGMSVIGEMLDGRRVNFRCEPDGSLYFYKSDTDAGILPDIVIADNKSEADDALSRVRVEGINIAEIADFTLLSDIGNLFETINSKWADSVPGLVRDGQYYLSKAKGNATTHQMATVFHPALQPGDRATLDIAGTVTNIHIMSTAVSFGFSEDKFNIQSTVEACE